MSGLRRWGPLALAVCLTLAATSLPSPAVAGDPVLPPWADKVGHVALYLTLGWSLGVGLWQGRGTTAGRFLAALAAAAAFAGLDEWHQAWIPTRTPSLADWAADVVGSGAGLAASLWLIPRWLRPSAPPGRDADRETSSESRGEGPEPTGAVVDVHTHLMPGVDDGARDRDEAERAAAELEAHGVTTAVTTPHLDASTLAAEEERRARLRDLDRGWERLRDAAAEGLTLHRGAEVRLDAPEPDLSDPRVRLAGGDAVLVEFATLELPPHGDRQLAEVAGAGWTPVLAHPERYRGIADRPQVVERWRSAGAVLQVNCSSLAGRYGSQAREVAWRLLESGQAGLMASDWHARGPIGVREAVRALRERGASGAARLLLETNPRRLLDGGRPEPVPPVPPPAPGPWQRLVRLVGG